MAKRSEEDKITQSSITVILGEKEYHIKPLVIKDSREWRKKAIALVNPLPSMVKINTDDEEGFKEALETLLVKMPDQVVELFFEYAKDLNRDQIESEATDAEMARAFQEVIVVAFPLAQSAPDVISRLYSEEETAKKVRKKTSP